ncbi:MAG TPA: glycoside hydrolase family 127 protein, partial [Cyclobacteriaceae bacterium]|nr:glycoside hydrolase family 127 protein [Cyclobacteriaceae bacterium]
LLRIPGWARGEAVPGDLYAFKDKTRKPITINVNGKPYAFTEEKGFAVINRSWKKGDVVSFELPMEVQKIIANEKVEADRDRISIQRGPIVYAAEWSVFKDGNIRNLVFDSSADFTPGYDAGLFNGVGVVKTKASMASRNADGTLTYAPGQDVTLIPYYTWNNNGPGEMKVWLPVAESSATPVPAPTIASKSKVTASRRSRTLMSVNDQMEPKHSNDQTIIFYHWWPLRDTVQWIQYDFEKPATVSSANVYWFDDGPYGGCRIPAGWRILYKKDEEWVPVKIKTPYEIAKDKYSGVTFEPVTTNALRLEVTLPTDNSSGVMEWKVD